MLLDLWQTGSQSQSECKHEEIAGKIIFKNTFKKTQLLYILVSIKIHIISGSQTWSWSTMYAIPVFTLARGR